MQQFNREPYWGKATASKREIDRRGLLKCLNREHKLAAIEDCSVVKQLSLTGDENCLFD
jgi:hypothetical protein